jgi:hypothetical protein
LSSPVKLKKLGVVERVIMNMYDAQGDLQNAVANNDLLLGTRQIITPYNWALVVVGNRIQCIKQQNLANEPSNDSLEAANIIADSGLTWNAVIDLYGTLRPGVSQIRLIQPDESEVIGTIVVDPNDARFVLFDVDADTVPQNTLNAVDAVINPLTSGPAQGLDSTMEGQRYLLTEDTGTASEGSAAAWDGGNGRPLVAEANDIIEYTNQYWQVAFRAEGAAAGQYVTNLTTGIQYEWNGEAWIKSYQGVYPGGTWRLVL